MYVTKINGNLEEPIHRDFIINVGSDMEEIKILVRMEVGELTEENKFYRENINVDALKEDYEFMVLIIK